MSIRLPSIRTALQKLLGIVPTLDLHGLGVKDAIIATERFVRETAEEGYDRVRIVYGKGRGSPGGVGVLRQVIPRWIDEHGGAWVARYERQLDASGEDGGLVAWLRDPEAPQARR